DAVAGATISPAVKVGIYDQYGNLTHSTATVSLVISGATPPSLVETASLRQAHSTAAFRRLSVHKTGTFTLDATSGVLLGDTSTSFPISPAAALLPYSALFRSDAVAGATISPAVKVGIYDQYGNLTHSTATVSLVISGATPP